LSANSLEVSAGEPHLLASSLLLPVDFLRRPNILGADPDAWSIERVLLQGLEVVVSGVGSILGWSYIDGRLLFLGWHVLLTARPRTKVVMTVEGSVGALFAARCTSLVVLECVVVSILHVLALGEHGVNLSHIGGEVCSTAQMLGRVILNAASVGGFTQQGALGIIAVLVFE
jgi:hypothetical protein